MVTLLMVRPWQDPKTGNWYFRKRIPARFLAVADKKPGDQVKYSLGTQDRKAAKDAWPGALARYAAQEAEWEKALRAEALTPARAKELAAGWAAWLANGGSLDVGREDDTVFAPWVEVAARTPERLARMNARIEAHAEEALRLEGLAVTPATRPLLLREIAMAAMHAYLLGSRSGLNIVNPKAPIVTGFNRPVAEVA